MTGNIDIPAVGEETFIGLHREIIMSVVPVADVLRGRVAVDSEVTVRGWVRVPAEILKLAFFFLAVYDGSCFDPVQAVINNSLPNYNQEVLRLTTGCSVIVTGKVVALRVRVKALRSRRPAWK